MKLNYTLDKTDFLNHQLYLASNSERIRKNRLKGRVWMIVLFLSLAYLFYIKLDRLLMFYFLGAAIIAALFYPYYSRLRYERHYTKHIDENYGNRINKPVTIQFADELIHSKDELSEGSVNLSAVTEIIEVPTAIYVRLAANSLILPKKQIKDIEEAKVALKAIAARYHIAYRDDTNWQWK